MRCPTHRPSALLDDNGSVTIEAAFGLAGIVTVTLLVVSAMITLASYIAAVDMAGAAARAHSLGETFEPERGEVALSSDGTWATATVSIDTGVVPISASAVYPAEMATS
ncbi:hypothetical protein WG915_08965 [Corynebacterium sp. H128]|uniref:hypothetical protein n=1 Tax=unclassified Corynebacterium TaxID=2624378 RepID=UPI003099C2CE